MNFLYPAFLIAALAVALPVVLHLLRRDVAPDLPFTAVRLMKRSPVERSRRRRLRDILLLAARVAALLLLAAAFARPFAPAAASVASPLRIVAIDRSFSMGAPGQFDRARELARAAIDEAGFSERVALIAFDDRADVAAPPGSATEARRALDGIEVGYGGTRFSSLLARASDLAAGGPARLIVVSDMQRAGLEGEAGTRVPASVELDIRSVGAAAQNLGVADVRQVDSGVTATIRNAGSAGRDGVVVLRADGRELARAGYTVPASATLEVRMPWKGSAAGLEVAITDPGGYPGDDRRFLIAPGSAAPGALVISSSESAGFYLRRALEAAFDDATAPIAARFVTPQEVAGGRAETIARHRAVVLLTTRSLDRASREAVAALVRSGGGLFIVAGPEVEPAVAASLFDWPTSWFSPEREQRAASLTVTDVRHPVFRPFGGLVANLGQVRFNEVWRLAGDGWHVPARFEDGTPALLERTEGQGRIVLFASDLDRRWNDFPVHPAFVPFVVETMRHVSSGLAEPSTFVVGQAPAAAGAAPGIHRLSSGRAIAVNVDPRESGTAVLTPEEFRSALEVVPNAPVDAAVEAEQTEARQSLWQYGLLLMIGVLIAESFVGRA